MGRPSHRDGRGGDSLPEVRKGLEGPPEGLGVVGKTSLKVQKGSGVLPGGPGVVKRPIRKSRIGLGALSEVGPGWEALSEVLEES